MRVITKQIKALKEHADYMQEIGRLYTASIIRHAAETIEALLAKVQAANMERSTAYYNGEWIPVTERLPEDEQEILFSTKTGRVHSGKYHDDDSANQWYSHKDKCRAWNNVVSAWMPLPDVYREDGE